MKGLYRNMMIYLVKKWTGVTNTEIGEFFGGFCYYAVSKISTRFSEKLKMDKKHNKAVQEIVAYLSQPKA